MNSSDVVARSKNPPCLPLPASRSERQAEAWAMGSIPIIFEHIDLREMRVLRTLKKLIKADWPEGLLAMGQALDEKLGQEAVDHFWWNNATMTENLIVLAPHKQAFGILAMLATNDAVRSRISDFSVGLALEKLDGEPEARAGAEDFLISMISRRQHFFAGNAQSPGARLAKTLAKTHQDALLVNLGALPHLVNLQKHWIHEGGMLARNGKSHASPPSDEQEQDMVAMVANPGVLLRHDAWQAWGDSIMRMYIRHQPDALPDLVKQYARLLENPQARSLVKVLDAWRRKHHLEAAIEGRDTSRPRKTRGI